MKKILLATSILAGTAGFAAADITLSGDARMGLQNTWQPAAGADDSTGFTSRFRVAFTATGASDNGLEFGAFVRLHQGVQGEQGTKGQVWVSGAFGKLTMGDVDSAALKATGGHVDQLSLTNQGDLNELNYLGHEAQNAGLFYTAVGSSTAANSAALYEYSANGFGFYLSASNPRNPSVWETTSYAAGASYAIDGYKFGIGYESADGKNGVNTVDAEQWTIGADADFGQFVVKARYIDGDLKQNGVKTRDVTQYALSGTYKADALAVTAFVTRKEAELAGANIFKRDVYGIGASYDLGGGASVVGGIANRKDTDGANPTDKDTLFDLGLAFKF